MMLEAIIYNKYLANYNATQFYIRWAILYTILYYTILQFDIQLAKKIIKNRIE